MPKALHTGPYKLFRALLAQARQHAGLTQAAVARKLGKPQSFVAKYENGERRLDVLEFLDVAAAINCDPVSILKKLRREL